MCKQDDENVKVAFESVLSNKGESRRYALDQVFAGGGGLSPYTAELTSNILLANVTSFRRRRVTFHTKRIHRTRCTVFIINEGSRNFYRVTMQFLLLLIRVFFEVPSKFIAETPMKILNLTALSFPEACKTMRYQSKMHKQWKPRTSFEPWTFSFKLFKVLLRTARPILLIFVRSCRAASTWNCVRPALLMPLKRFPALW